MEAMRLVEGIGRGECRVVQKIFAPLAPKHEAGVFGKGKIKEIAVQLDQLRRAAVASCSTADGSFSGEAAEDPPAELLVVVNVSGISPMHRHHLEEVWGCTVIDRYGLILEVFRARAVTAEAKLQVELAQAPYVRGLLATIGIDDGGKQRGGIGLATFGSGETSLEKGRRRLDKRLAMIRKSLKKLATQRQLVRQQRVRNGAAVVALVGYTNAGKSALLQALTGAQDDILSGANYENSVNASGSHSNNGDSAAAAAPTTVPRPAQMPVGSSSGGGGGGGSGTNSRDADDDVVPLSQDRLFHTLDCTARATSLGKGMDAIVLDTVGFVSNLPHKLVESFQSTLQDVADATVLVHVRDVSHPESQLQKEEVLAVLVNELKIPESLQRSMVEVYHKSDLLDNEAKDGLDPKKGVLVSSLDGTGIERLQAVLRNKICASTGKRSVVVRMESRDGAQLSWLYKHAAVQGCDSSDCGLWMDVSTVMDLGTRRKHVTLFPPSSSKPRSAT